MLSTSLSALGQMWSKSFGTNAVDAIYTACATSDGYAFGMITTGLGAGGGDIMIVKTDLNGDTLWTTTMGTPNMDTPRSIKTTSDGGYIVAGSVDTSGKYSLDVFIAKLNSSGDTLWTRTYGGSANENAVSVIETSNGGYALCGTTTSFGSGTVNGYVIRMNASGDTLWTRVIEGAPHQYLYSIRETAEGDFVVGGMASFNDPAGDFSLIKMNADGTILWSKAYGGSGNEAVFSMDITSDGGFVMSGYSNSVGSGLDMYVVLTDGDGNLIWSKNLGGLYNENGESIQATSDDGFILAGYSGISPSNGDLLVLKLNASGDTLWTKTYGGSGDDRASCVLQVQDGGYLIAGYSSSYDPSVDGYILKTDANGSVPCKNTSHTINVLTPVTTVTSGTPSITHGGKRIHAAVTKKTGGGSSNNDCLVTSISATALHNQFTVSPNPFSGSATIKAGRFSHPMNIAFYNAYGVKVAEKTMNSSETVFERDGLSSGVYFYLVTEDGIVTGEGKVIIQ